MSIIHLFDHGAMLAPQRPCFIMHGVAHSYLEVKALTERIARRLHSAGIGPGRQVGVLSINDPTAFACVLGALRSGNVWAPLNPRTPPTEQTWLLNNFAVAALFFHSLLAPVVEAIRGQLTQVKEFVCLDQPLGSIPSLAQWLEGVPAGAVECRVRADDCAVLAATGGTTGLPKGVMLSQRNVETFAASFMCLAPLDKPPVHLVAVPMTHAAGILCFPMLARGGTNVMLAKPDAQEILAAIPQYGVTDLFLPPTLIYALLAQPNLGEFDFSSLRYFLYGAAPMSTEKLREAINRFGPVMTQAFGQTEAPMICCFMGPQEHFCDGQIAADSRLSSCGRPTPFVELGLMNEDGQLAPPGERGEIVVRGDLVMLGYYQNAEATAAASAHGWHHTGDIGFQDESGYIHIVDRKKDMIISGGYNIYSAEVEQSLLNHAAVLDCAVIGVPDDKWGEAVKAVVQLKPGCDATPDELLAHSKAQVGSIKAPKSVEVWSDLPRSSVGKVLKRDIRERYWAGRERTLV